MISKTSAGRSKKVATASKRKAGRPRTGNAKKLIAIRIDPKLLTQLRKVAQRNDMPYQTYMHELLEKAVGRASA